MTELLPTGNKTNTRRSGERPYPTAFALVFQSNAINLSMMKDLSGCMILICSGITERAETMYSEDRARCGVRSSSRYTPVANRCFPHHTIASLRQVGIVGLTPVLSKQNEISKSPPEPLA